MQSYDDSAEAIETNSIRQTDIQTDRQTDKDRERERVCVCVYCGQKECAIMFYLRVAC